jgi:hypothetical protein
MPKIANKSLNFIIILFIFNIEKLFNKKKLFIFNIDVVLYLFIKKKIKKKKGKSPNCDIINTFKPAL